MSGWIQAATQQNTNEQLIYCVLKFIYSEKATKFCDISTALLSYVVPVKSKMEILQNFVAFSEYMNFKILTAVWKKAPYFLFLRVSQKTIILILFWKIKSKLWHTFLYMKNRKKSKF